MQIFKKFCLAIILITPLCAVDISIKRDNNNSVSSMEVDVLRTLLESQRVMLKDDDITQMIGDDRSLSGAYLSKYSVPDDLKTEFKLTIEKKLADMFIEKYKKSLDLNDDVLKSYYIDHQNEFSNKIMIDVDFFITDTFEKSLKLYEINKESPDKTYKYAEDNNITVTPNKLQIQTLSESVKYNLRSIDEENYLMPPLFFIDHYTVIYIKKIEKNVMLPYDEEMSRKIRDYLVQKNHKDLRVQLLKKLNND